MVWIHGGGLQVGDGFKAGDPMDRGLGGFYDGSAIAEKHGVVVISVQYRLGAFGFLAVPREDGGAGNFGLMDQRLALDWVQRNVGGFGGDADKVTVFGESAGAISICYHLVAPQSRNLFRAALLQSGSCAMQVQTREAGEAFARSFAREVVGCAWVDSSTSMAVVRAECLETAPASKLTWPLPDIGGGGRLRNVSNSSSAAAPAFPWSMTVDGVDLDAAPAELLREKQVNAPDVVLGFNTHEFQLLCEASLGAGDGLADCGFSNVLPAILGLGKPPYSDHETIRVLAHFTGFAAASPRWPGLLASYPLENYENASTVARLSAMMVDSRNAPGAAARGRGAWIGRCETLAAAEDMARHGARVRVYHFARRGPAMHVVAHFAEVPYVFDQCAHCGRAKCCQGVEANETSAVALEARVATLVGQLWTDFATNLGPRPQHHWPPLKAQGDGIMPTILRIDDGLALEVAPAVCRKWRTFLDEEANAVPGDDSRRPDDARQEENSTSTTRDDIRRRRAMAEIPEDLSGGQGG